MNESSKSRRLAKRSGTAGVVICISWCVAALFYLAPVDNAILAYMIRLAHCLLVVLPIPAIATGLWSLRGLNRKDDSQEIGHALFGTISGILSVVATFLVIFYLAEHLL